MTRKDDLLVAGSETIIGTGVKVKGSLYSEGDITVDGHLEGDIRAAGNVTVGVNAVIKAKVAGDNVSIAGDLVGNVTAQGQTTITETGHLQGDITTNGIVINAGGLFQGKITMTIEETAGHHSGQNSED